MNFDIPILFIIFNRPDTTALVFEEIKKIKPQFLYVAADGPRSDRADEEQRCNASRNVVLNGIDWECEVKTLFHKQNQGCKKAVSGAINWFFDQVEMGIILEDDCLPDLSFFSFCRALLLKFKDDTRVMHISGTNFLFQDPTVFSYSYYFSKYISIWGWASWSRAWKMYDPQLLKWPEYKANGLLNNILNDQIEQEYFAHIFDLLHADKFDTWDLQLFFANFFNHGASISPAVNLVKNIGFREDATHTHSESKLSNVSSVPMKEIRHPDCIVIRHDLDAINFNISFHGDEIRKSKTAIFKLNHLLKRVKNKIKSYYS